MNAPGSLLKHRLARLASTSFAALLVTSVMTPADAQRRQFPKPEEAPLSRPAGTPLLAVVSLGEQRVTIYDADGQIMRAPVSSGQTSYETPAGIYSIIQKNREHYSNIYDGASMPYMQRITWSGIAMHAGALPGYPASHGCIRLPHAFAERIFDMTKMGMRVVVTRNDMTPVEIAHPALFRPMAIGGDIARATTAAPETPTMRLGGSVPAGEGTPKVETVRSMAARKAAEADAAAKRADEARMNAVRRASDSARHVKTLRMAEFTKARAEAQLRDAERYLQVSNTPAATERAEEAKTRAQAKLTEAVAQLETAKAEAQPKLDAVLQAREEAKKAEAVRVAAVEAAKEAQRKMAPISVFISRQTQRIYVRQSQQSVFDMPITIKDADKPIGTHLYTAIDYINDGADVRWNALSMYGGSAKPAPVVANPQGRRVAVNRDAPATATDVTIAKAALERVEIPQEALVRISEVVSPGSSLIISDEPISKETGNGTDFIVLMSGEPQGGIKIRRRDPMSRYRRYDGGSSWFW